MATAKLHCAFILLLYLQVNYAQQGLANNQNAGGNNVIGLQQQALQRTNSPNNINQIPNGLNINLPQQSILQQANLQQPIGANFQGNFQQAQNLPANLQPQDVSGPFANLQFNKQGFFQLSPGAANPSKQQTLPAQCNNIGARQNPLITQQQNMGLASNVPMSQTQNAAFSSNSLAEIAALKGLPSLLSLITSQSNTQTPQNQQMTAPNFNPTPNQLTDAQKQYLVRALQSQSSGQNQPGFNLLQNQFRMTGGDNQPAIVLQGTQVPQVTPQQPQAIVTPIGNQPQYIKVQAQPLPTYLQNQSPQMDDEALISYILSELQPSTPQSGMYPTYPVQKKTSKSTLSSLIPLIINLLKEKNNCGCNCGCPSNDCGNNNAPAPSIFSGYSSQKNYSQAKEQPAKTTSDVEKPKAKTNAKEQKNVKKNIVNVESEEVKTSSEENDSEYVDDSEED